MRRFTLLVILFLPLLPIRTLAESDGAEDPGSIHCCSKWYPFAATGPTATCPPTPTLTPTMTPTPSPTLTFTNSPGPTQTPTLTPTSTPTQTPTFTPTSTPTNTPTITPTFTPTFTPTLTFTPTQTPTQTPTSTPTFTPTQTPTNTQANFFKQACYTGNGTSQSFTGFGFKPDAVIVRRDNTDAGLVGVLSTKDMTAGDSLLFSNTAATTTGEVTSLDSDGFSIGASGDVNTNAKPYCYWAWKNGPNTTVGTYTGNATDNTAITGVGFQPEAVFIWAGSNNYWRNSTMSGDKSCLYQQFAGACTSNRIQSLDSNGFTIGNDGSVNTNLRVYFYLALNDASGVSGTMVQGSYSGNGSGTTRNISTSCVSNLIMEFIDGDTATQVNKCNGGKPAASAVDPLIWRFNSTNISGGLKPQSAANIVLNGDDNCNHSGTTYYYVGMCQ